MNEIIKNNLSIIHQRIAHACLKAGRDLATVQLLLATKTVSAEKIKQALRLGEALVGENKVQELKEKYAGLLDIPHQAHFIGHLQSNKIKEVLKEIRRNVLTGLFPAEALPKKMLRYLEEFVLL